MPQQFNSDKIRDQLLKLMTASNRLLESYKTKDLENQKEAISKLRDEYIKAVVLMKSENISKVPALLMPTAGHNVKLMFDETLAVDLGEL
jgi:hypothetical protein